MHEPSRLRAHAASRAISRLLVVAVLGLVAILALGGCGDRGASPGPSTTPSALDLQGTTWRGIRIRDAAPVVGAEPTITFDGTQAGGTTGCNTYGGTFTVGPDGAFTIASMIMTEMACDGPRGNQEAAVIEILSAADRIELLDGELRISGPSGEIVFAEDPR
ncbi:MAG TPA: META domain-containing protein [Candidatus Limnocylindrales bacterium]|nr:META domain-containing protein [Candidatus Limnocylindrales bacterium]